jgi:hypothetical protein
VLRTLYAGYYHAALAVLRLWLKASGLPLNGLWLRRGLAGTDWTPGGSDVDLAAALPELPVEQEMAWLDRWHEGLRRLRHIFPIIGETQLATDREWRRYLADGDIRALELPREAKPLLGQVPRPARPSAPAEESWLAARRSLDIWSEALHAYIRLAGLACDEKADDPRAAFNARKSLLDVARYGWALSSPDWEAFPRPQAAAVLSRGGGAAAQAVEALEQARGSREVRDAVETSLLVCAQELEASAGAVRGRLPAEAASLEPASAVVIFPEPEKAVLLEKLCLRLERESAGLLVGALHDSVNHWLLALRAGAGPDELRPAWRALLAVRREESALSQVLIPLPPEALRLALWSPHLEDPLRARSVLAALGRGAAAVCVSSGSSPLLRRHTLGLWRLAEAGIAAPPRPLAEALLRESLAHLLVNWRALGGPHRREDDYCRWTYLYGRVLSLRLFTDRGEARPVFPLEPLARRFAETYPEEAAAVRAGVLEAEDVGSWERHRPFFARQLRGSVGRVDELLAQEV